MLTSTFASPLAPRRRRQGCHGIRRGRDLARFTERMFDDIDIDIGGVGMVAGYTLMIVNGRAFGRYSARY
ncbi:hypothetical protein FsymDg_3169 [Candidatus Protofrankia datiscae]|uniref:Uncharacterized protein n=1 Tax=Candidatus Protofrankia datiscae TaxID=2716812 RepID=F8AYG7_9ACTN|nr:hypothetical protein FsymDg_3169 [Candidatus Protofrankia datiscae]